MFFGACYSERGDLHFWPHLRRMGNKNHPEKRVSAVGGRGLHQSSFLWCWMQIRCSYWAVTISMYTNTRHLQAQSESWCHISHFLRQFQSIHVNSDMSTKSTIIFSMFLIPAIRSITFLQLIWKIIRKFPPKHSWQKFQLSAGHWSEHSCTSVPSSSSLQLRGAPIGSCTRGGCDMQVGESWKCGEINWYNRIDSCILLWFFHSVTFPFRLSLYWLLILKSPQFGNL